MYSELTPEAKETARDWFAMLPCLYGWLDEDLKSLKTFGALVGCRFDWSVDLGNCGPSSVRVLPDPGYGTYYQDEPAKVEDFHHLKVDGSCPFTGYCADEDLLDGVRSFLADPHGSWLDVVQDCADRWLAHVVEGIEYSLSAESLAENIEANGYTFDANGNRKD
jgi:hypothetical protein